MLFSDHILIHPQVKCGFFNEFEWKQGYRLIKKIYPSQEFLTRCAMDCAGVATIALIPYFFSHLAGCFKSLYSYGMTSLSKVLNTPPFFPNNTIGWLSTALVLHEFINSSDWTIFSKPKKVTFSPFNEYRFYFKDDPPNIQYSAWTGKRV